MVLIFIIIGQHNTRNFFQHEKIRKSNKIYMNWKLKNKNLLFTQRN